MINDPLLGNKDGGEIQLPKPWQALPYLAMPDGAHNFEDGKIEQLCHYCSIFKH